MNRLLLPPRNFLKFTYQLNNLATRYSTQASPLKTDSNVPSKSINNILSTTKTSIKDIFFPRRTSLDEFFVLMKQTDFGYDKNEQKVFENILNELNASNANLPRVSSLMNILAHDMEHILPWNRQEKLSALWAKLKAEKIINFDADLYLAYMKATMSLDVNLNLVKDCLNEMKEAKINFTPEILSLQFDVFCRFGELEKAKQILTKNQSEITVNTDVFNSLIRAYLYNNNDSEAQQVYTIMKSRNLKLNSETFYNIFRHYLIESKNDEKLEQTYQNMIAEKISLSDSHGIKLINQYFQQSSENLNFENLEKTMSFFEKCGCKISLNNHIVWLNGLYERSKNLIDNVKYFIHVANKFDISPVPIDASIDRIGKPKSIYPSNVSETSSPKTVLVDFFYKYLSKTIESNHQSLDDIIKSIENTKFFETTLQFAMANLIKSNNITTYLAYAKKYNIEVDLEMMLAILDKSIQSIQTYKNYDPLNSLIKLWINKPTSVVYKRPLNNNKFSTLFQHSENDFLEFCDYLFQRKLDTIGESYQYNVFLSAIFAKQNMEYIESRNKNIDMKFNESVFDKLIGKYGSFYAHSVLRDKLFMSSLAMVISTCLKQNNEIKLDWVLNLVARLLASTTSADLMFSYSSGLTDVWVSRLTTKQVDTYLKYLIKNDIKFAMPPRKLEEAFAKSSNIDDIAKTFVKVDLKNAESFDKQSDLEYVERLYMLKRVNKSSTLKFEKTRIDNYLKSIKTESNPMKIIDYVHALKFWKTKTAYSLLSDDTRLELDFLDFDLSIGNYGRIKQANIASKVDNARLLRIIELGVMHKDRDVERYYDLMATKPSLDGEAIMSHYEFCLRNSRIDLFDKLNKICNNQYAHVPLAYEIDNGNIDKAMAVFSSIGNFPHPDIIKQRFRLIDALIMANDVDRLQSLIEQVSTDCKDEAVILNDIVCSLLRLDETTDDNTHYVKIKNILSHPKFAFRPNSVLQNFIYLCKQGDFDKMKRLETFCTENFPAAMNKREMSMFTALLDDVKTENKNYMQIRLDQIDSKFKVDPKVFIDLPLDLQEKVVQNMLTYKKEVIDLIESVPSKYLVPVLTKLMQNTEISRKPYFLMAYALCKTGNQTGLLDLLKANESVPLIEFFLLNPKFNFRVKNQVDIEDSRVELKMFSTLMETLVKDQNNKQANMGYLFDRYVADYKTSEKTASIYKHIGFGKHLFEYAWYDMDSLNLKKIIGTVGLKQHFLNDFKFKPDQMSTKRLRFMLETIMKLPNSPTFTQVLKKRFIEQYTIYGMKPDDKVTKMWTNLFNDFSISIELPKRNVTKTSAVETQSDSVVEAAAVAESASSQIETKPVSDPIHVDTESNVNKLDEKHS